MLVEITSGQGNRNLIPAVGPDVCTRDISYTYKCNDKQLIKCFSLASSFYFQFSFEKYRIILKHFIAVL